MNADRLRQIYKLHGVDKLIEITLKKDDMIKGLEERLRGLNYSGSIYIGGKRYSVYLREDK